MKKDEVIKWCIANLSKSELRKMTLLCKNKKPILDNEGNLIEKKIRVKAIGIGRGQNNYKRNVFMLNIITNQQLSFSCAKEVEMKMGINKINVRSAIIRKSVVGRLYKFSYKPFEETTN